MVHGDVMAATDPSAHASSYGSKVSRLKTLFQVSFDQNFRGSVDVVNLKTRPTRCALLFLSTGSRQRESSADQFRFQPTQTLHDALAAQRDVNTLRDVIRSAERSLDGALSRDEAEAS